ncbi:hypothetical protein PVAP13_8KG008451 [Panicum virgatum]|uniref:Uncharacterized protein n=1 Tax=Panicum virgatum TaxID=38727 RepID=A0A8T0PIL2_PANVG|nr:hypothetical protein PVAP13_8KG008451 [Panicum virgatum]
MDETDTVQALVKIDIAAIEIEYTCRSVKQPRILLSAALSISNNMI